MISRRSPGAVERLAAASGASISAGTWTVALLAATVACFVVLDASGAIALALGGPRSLPTVLAGTLLLAAAWLAWVLSGEQPRDADARTPWRVGAVLLAIVGLERLTSLHAWVGKWEARSMTTVLVPVVLVGTISWALLATRWADRGRGLDLFLAGGVLWLVGQLLETLDDASLRIPAAAAELAGCGLLAGALVLTLPRHRLPWHSGAPGDRRGEALAERLVRSLDPVRVGAWLTVGIVTFSALGGLLFGLDLRHATEVEGTVDRADHPLQWFDPNQELTYNTYFSALILLAAAGPALLLARLRAGGSRIAWIGLAAVLLAMSADELVNIHGKSQGITGVLAQVTFAPVILAALAVGVATLRRMSADRAARALYVGGAVAWVAALAVDVLFGRESPFGILEEALEMAGSSMFLLALLVFAQTTFAKAPAERSPRPEW